MRRARSAETDGRIRTSGAVTGRAERGEPGAGNRGAGNRGRSRGELSGKGGFEAGSRIGSGLLLSLLALLLALPGPSAWAGTRVSAVAGIPPVAGFVREIGGDRVAVTSLLPPGADAHTWEPRPNQMRAAARASLFFSVGLPFEEAMRGRMTDLNPSLRTIRVDAGIRRIPMAAEEHAHHGETEPEGHVHEGADPHVWLSVREAPKMIEAIRAALVRVDPSGRAGYDARARRLRERVVGMDETFRTLLAGRRGSKILVYHPAWGYFCRDYGLVQIAVEVEGKEPKPAQMAHLIDEAREEGARVIFVQPQMSRRAADEVARAVGGRVVLLDPLDGDWMGQMRRTAEAFRSVR